MRLRPLAEARERKAHGQRAATILRHARAVPVRIAPRNDSARATRSIAMSHAASRRDMSRPSASTVAMWDSSLELIARLLLPVARLCQRSCTRLLSCEQLEIFCTCLCLSRTDFRRIVLIMSEHARTRHIIPARSWHHGAAVARVRRGGDVLGDAVRSRTCAAAC
jgi:hypothetical protein